jgi:hypothetical protein
MCSARSAPSQDCNWRVCGSTRETVVDDWVLIATERFEVKLQIWKRQETRIKDTCMWSRDLVPTWKCAEHKPAFLYN